MLKIFDRNLFSTIKGFKISEIYNPDFIFLSIASKRRKNKKIPGKIPPLNFYKEFKKDLLLKYR